MTNETNTWVRYWGWKHGIMIFLSPIVLPFPYDLYLLFLMHGYFSYFPRGVYFAPPHVFSVSPPIIFLRRVHFFLGVKYTPLSQPLFRLHLRLARLFVKKERKESPWLTHGRAVHDPPISQDHHMAISIPQSAPS